MAHSEFSADRLVKHSTIYALGNISRQLVGFVMLPLYTRYLTPADYGVVGLLLFALALLEPLIGAINGEATLKFYYEEHNEAQRRLVISTSLVITGVISTTVACIAFASRNAASELIFGTEKYGLAVGLFAFVFLTQAVEYYGLTFIRIQQKPTLFIAINLSKLVLQLALNIWFIVYLKLGVTGVVLSGIVSSALYATGLALYTIYFNGIACDPQIARRMVVYSWPLWLSSLASFYIFSANRYYIRIFGSMDQVGYYELAARFAAILGLIVWQPFSQFWDVQNRSGFATTAGEPDAPAVFSSVFEFASVVLFAGALGISIFADPVIQLMSAPAFHRASALVPWLAFGWLFGFLTLFANFSFLITEETVLISRNNYITVVIITVLNLLLIPRFFGYIEAPACRAAAGALFTQFLIVRRAARPYYDMRLALAPVLAMLAICCAGYIGTRMVHMTALWLDVA